jgi:hypothetical protein
MATTEKNQSTQARKSAKKQPTVYQEPKRLSKIGIWRRENPGGMLTVIDRRAVNK